MTEADKCVLVEILTPILDNEGIELVDIETRAQTLRLLIHKPKGISVADCQTVNYAVRPLLGVYQYLTNYALLEVASPGVDRPLRTAKDFHRNRGRTVQIEIEPEPGEQHVQVVHGTIVNVKPETVVIQQSNGENVSVYISCIREAYVHLKW